MSEMEASQDDAEHDVSDEDWSIRLAFAIHDAARLRRVVFDNGLKPVGGTRSQYMMLAYLSREDGLTQSDLAIELDLGKVAVGALVDRLEAAGTVERRPDAQDRRIKRICLTSEGRKVVSAQRKIAGKLNASITEGVSQEDLRTTARTLRKAIINMRGMINGNKTS